jgi:hypothetical protein
MAAAFDWSGANHSTATVIRRHCIRSKLFARATNLYINHAEAPEVIVGAEKAPRGPGSSHNAGQALR